MDDERIQVALARITTATRRIEAAAASAARAAPPSFAPIDHDLASRHQALKAETRAALAELDNLIGEIER